MIKFAFKSCRMTALPNKSTRLAIAIAAACTVVLDSSHAFDFTWTPTARTSMRLDDNIRGASRNAEEAVGFDMGGGVNLRAQSEYLSSELFPRFNIRRFAIGNDLDADEYSVGFNNDWLQERYSAGLDFSYARDSTLTTEATDTGLRNDVTDRDSINVQPNASYFLTDRLALQSSFLFNDVTYIDAERSGLFAYQYLQGTAGITYQWRDDVSGFANFFVSNFSVQEQESKTQSYGGQSGLTWRWDETLELSGALGWLASSIEFTEQRLELILEPFPRVVLVENMIETSVAGPIASATIRKIFDSGLVRLDYSRQVTPSGRGSQSTADRIALSIVKGLTNNFSILFDGQYEMRTALAQETGSNLRSQQLNRNYAELRGTIRYRISETWSLDASYRHGRNESTDLNSSFSADTNTIYLAVQFNGLPNTFWNGF